MHNLNFKLKEPIFQNQQIYSRDVLLKSFLVEPVNVYKKYESLDNWNIFFGAER